MGPRLGALATFFGISGGCGAKALWTAQAEIAALQASSKSLKDELNAHVESKKGELTAFTETKKREFKGEMYGDRVMKLERRVSEVGAKYGECWWENIGYEKTHRHSEESWVGRNQQGAFLVEIDFDGIRPGAAADVHPANYPIVAKARYCKPWLHHPNPEGICGQVRTDPPRRTQAPPPGQAHAAG